MDYTTDDVVRMMVDAASEGREMNVLPMSEESAEELVMKIRAVAGERNTMVRVRIAPDGQVFCAPVCLN